MPARQRQPWAIKTDNPDLEAEGRMQEAKADVKQAGENVKDTGDDVTDALRSAGGATEV